MTLLVPETPPTVSVAPVLRVVIPCSKWKVASEATATQYDLDERRAETYERFAVLAHPARDLYTGRAYLRARAAVDRFAERRPDLPIALHIASAGYGIVDADDLLIPYDAALGSRVHDWTARGQYLKMPQRVLSLIESCDVAILALSRPYLTAAGLATIAPRRGSAVVIGVSQSVGSPLVRTVVASREQARGLRTTEREVASAVLARLLDMIAARGLDVARQLPSNPLEWPAP